MANTSWKPYPRPEWVQRLNEEGDGIDIAGIVPLDEDSLLRSAIQSSGLSDFGSDEWRAPFRAFIKALEEESGLNLVGRIRTRSEIVQLLVSRLQVEDTYKRHPEIADEKIVQPLIVIGQGRCGTSYLCDLLATNTDNKPLLHWEALMPCPPPAEATYRNDPRIPRAHLLIDQWNRVTPEFKAMHEFGAEIPMEDMLLQALTFISPGWLNAFGQVPSYNAFLMAQDPRPAFRYHQRVLKLLQWKNPRRHWVLKDVTHIDYVPILLETYPDACLIWPHRDPMRASASALDIAGTLQWGRCDHPFSKGSYDFMTEPEISSVRFNRVIDWIEQGVLPKPQLFNLLFRDLVKEPMKTMEALYAYFALPFSEDNRRNLEAYLVANPRHHRSSYKYTIAPEFKERARKAYQRYQDYFGVPNE